MENYSLPTTVSHTYASPGNYIVCLSVNDSDGFCKVTYCDTITVGQPNNGCGVLNLSLIDTDCNACNGSVIASVSGGNGPYVYSWIQGTQTGNNTNTGLCKGTYTVSATDSLGGCVLTANYTIGDKCTQPGSCDAAFTYVNDSAASGFTFITASNDTSGNRVYVWDFGDGNILTKTDPSSVFHTFSSPDFYNVCLTVTDNMDSSCSGTTCMGVQIEGDCTSDCVWPGDANNDGVANNFDI